LPHGDLLAAAGKAIITSDIATKAFGAAVGTAISKQGVTK